jgi:serine/threonine-protein kinase RsbW
MSVIHLQIPASAEYLDIVRLSLYGVATKLGFSYEDIEDLKVAVSEACNNAILHGEPQTGNGQIAISYESGEGFLKVKVKDDGAGYEPHDQNRQTAPYAGDSLSRLQTGGLGMYLMEALMDEVVVDTKDGTEVTLVKYVHTKNTE